MLRLQLMLVATLLVGASTGWAHEPKEPRIPSAVEAGSDYEADLAKIDEHLQKAEPSERLFWLYTRATLTGDPADWNGAWHLVGGDIEEDGELPDDGAALLYRATIALELHRPDDAETALNRLDEVDAFLAGGTYPKLLRGDVARARDDLRGAKQIYESVLAKERTWEVLSRLAYLERQAGHYRKADRLYEEAQEPLTVKEMRRWAWLEVQRGMVDLDRGREENAEEHFRRADRAYSTLRHDR